YEVSANDLNSKDYQYFNFDTFSKITLDDMRKDNKNIKFVLRATSSTGAKGRLIEWDSDVELIVKYIEKRRDNINIVQNFTITKELGMIKLNWDIIKSNSVAGYYVVRNTFHKPKHFADGVKIYGGKDTYTYDNYASFDKEKYYSVFSYDNVPNFSEASTVYYNPLERY
nr:peptidase [Sulfurovaceae bacterium]